MQFSDDGIVLAARAHGETHAVAEILTAHHGRWAGLVYGGQGRRMTPLLQPGNGVVAQWRGGAQDSLGAFTLEISRARAAEAMSDRLALAALSAACAVASAALPEREPHPRIYHTLKILLDHLGDDDVWPALTARWELGLLAELGFGLTLDRCAATGAREDLVYISPKSACAVSRTAGDPYKDRLLPLPAFMRHSGAPASRADARAGLETTGYFIETRILHPSGKELPEARRRLALALGAPSPT